MPMTVRKQNGFSLIEVLIALLILAIGLFGMASLMMTSMKSNQSASMRSQASWLAYDMFERMRLNSAVATGTTNYVTTAAAAAPSDPSCKSSGCSATNVAVQDLFEWKTQLAQSGLSGAVAIDTAPNGYRVTITWQEDSSTACPANQCSFVLRANL